ncbi:MAG: 2OG-Fe(II) oxygenase [Myxococcota bacterium]|nr:2OG-Fe(II) oxygenase [Myxococcota bacterium]
MVLELRERLHEAGLASRARVLSEEPWVVVVDDYLPRSERNALVRAAVTRLQSPLLDTGAIESDAAVRSGRVAWIHHDHAPRIRALADRIAKFVRIPLVNAESFQVVRYGPGHEYRPHFDGYDMSSSIGQANAARGGQRIVTALLYLSAPAIGGATGFPALDMDVEAVPGRLLLFWNVGQDIRTPHPRARHAGNPVEVGEKWIANLWFRERRYRGV